ncbi:MAG TPA: hypothetical protein VF624_05260 [Tepidisphaeraceae bacterium]|jgi:hypothetical protein
MSRYADWKAPPRDGEHLLWPTASRLLDETNRNAAALASANTPVQNADLSHLRAELRAAVTGDAGRPIVATGHQIEMYHPGVWAKNVLIEAAAARMGGVALHVAVDTDSPKHLELRWPAGKMPITDDPAVYDGAWSALVGAPTSVHTELARTTFNDAAGRWPFAPTAGPFFDALAAQGGKPLPAALLAATGALDRALGLGRRMTIVLSDLIATPAYNAFAHHIGASAARFADAYNAALAAYRVANKVKAPSRPMPDLLATPDRVELPFWLDDLAAGTRGRAFAVRRGGAWTLECEAPFDFDESAGAHVAAAALAEHLAGARMRLSPRALTLTMFVRLLLVDQFVHGIGGGRYDQVCDSVIERFFRMPVPTFSVTTATLYFPTAGQRGDVCVPCIKSEGHALRHAVLGAAKRPHLAAIEAAPRRSPARRAAYVAMHQTLAVAYTRSSDVPAWRERLHRAVAQDQADAQVFDRELFYGIQPCERLTAMIEQYRIALA